MKAILLELYSFNELDKDAKGKALTTYRDLNVDFNWWDSEFENFVQLCASIGIAVKKNSIVFRGFYAQGDGSGFTAAVKLPDYRKPSASRHGKTMHPSRSSILFPLPSTPGYGDW